MDLNQPEQVEAMLEDVGLSPEDLFKDVPQPVRRRLDIEEGMTDREVEHAIRGQLDRNVPVNERPALVGGGSYAHWIPPETRYMATRGELLTAYTPYQAEINQGILQSLFEFQTLSTRLLELDVANTGMYDGASAAGEAVLTALRVGGGSKVLVPEHLPRQRESILHNYVVGAGGELVPVPTDESTGTIDLAALEDAVDGETACVHLESPNAFGCLEPLTEAGEIADDAGARFTVNVPEVTSLGLVHGPGHHGADIATAEGQPLALPPSFGGPALGLFATRDDYLRKTPGRLVGETEDAEGRQAYCLTLQTREQHIRRSRATSNICTNQSFLALMFTATMAAYGENGFRDLAKKNAAEATRLREGLVEAGAEVPYQGTPHYNEVLYEPPGDPEAFREAALERGVDPGVPASRLFGGDADGLVACVTEVTPDHAVDDVLDAVEEVA